jgi:hypothetical protein
VTDVRRQRCDLRLMIFQNCERYTCPTRHAILRASDQETRISEMWSHPLIAAHPGHDGREINLL